MLGDAGTATLLEKSGDARDELIFSCITDGAGFRADGEFDLGFRHRSAHKPIYLDENHIKMDDLEIFNFVLSAAPAAIREYCAANDSSVTDYDCFAFHQASYFSLKQIAKKLKIDFEKMPLSLKQFGNTGPASVATALIYRYGEDRSDQRIRALMAGFGVGLSVSVTSSYLNTTDIYPFIETDEWFDDGLFS